MLAPLPMRRVPLVEGLESRATNPVIWASKWSCVKNYFEVASGLEYRTDMRPSLLLALTSSISLGKLPPWL